MDTRGLPSVVFVAAFLVGVVAKLWRAVDLYGETDALDGFRWLPFGIGSELLVAGLFAIVVAVAGRIWFWLAAVVIGLGLGGQLFWMAMNDISFRISQVGISWARLRGDEGVQVADFHLMAMGDVYPAIAYVVVSVVVGGAAGSWLYRNNRQLPAVVFVVAAVVGAAVWIVDLQVFSRRNFGMGESPVLLLARTWVAAGIDREEVRLPTALTPPASREERLAMLQPQEAQPPSTTPTKAAPAVHNGVLWFSEGVARKQTSLELMPRGEENTTPQLWALLQERGGLDLENYYTTYHKSIAAIYSMVCADFPPPDARNIMEINPRIDCGSLPEILSSHGVHVGLFHGGDFGFYDKLQLLGARGFETQQDARSIADKGIWEYGWGVDDRAVADAVLRWVDSLPKGDRFFAVVIPITAHYPYRIPPDVKPAFPGSNAKNRFYSAVHFLDDAFGRLDRGLRARGVADDTALIYLADHGETVAERPRASPGRRLAYEPSLHVPLVIVAPKVFPTWQKNGRVGSHVDLLPTVLDLMGLPPDPRHVGRSLIAADFAPRRVFVGANNGPKYLGFVDGRQKFVVNRSTGQAELYNLDSDPFEQHNLADVEVEKATRLTREALAFADGQLAWLKSAPRIAGDVDTQVGLVQHAAVRVVNKDGSVVDCVAKDEDVAIAPVDADLNTLPGRRECPGFSTQPFLGHKRHKLGRIRDCVLVNVPERGGALEIKLGKHDWLPFLTRIRSSVSKSKLDDDDQATLTAFGDGKQGQEKVIALSKTNLRVTFPSSNNELVVRLSGERPFPQPICLTFTETAWRGSAVGKGDDKGDDTKADEGKTDDDVQGAAPKAGL